MTRLRGRCDSHGYDGSVAVKTPAKLDARALRRDFPDLRAGDPRQAARIPRLREHVPEAAPDARRDDDVLRDVVRERPSRRHVLAERATSGLEGAREKTARLPQRAGRRARSSSSATRPRRSISSPTRGGWNNLGPGDAVVVTELEHHSNFVPWQYIAQRHGRRVPDAADRRERRARPLRPRRDRARGQREGRRDEPRLELARDDPRPRAARRRGRTSRERSSSATRRRPRRT